MPDATIAVDVLPAAPSGALRLGLKDAWFLVGWDAACGFDCQQSGSVRGRIHSHSD